MKRIAPQYGIGANRFLKLGLLKLSCFEPDAREGRRIFVEFSDKVIRSFRY
jgi:hypothetical protein